MQKFLGLLCLSKVLIISSVLFLYSCTSEEDAGSGQSANQHINNAIHKASAQYSIPAQLLVGVGYLESHWYVQKSEVSDGSIKRELQPQMTVVGITKERLGIIQSKDSDKVEVQIDAYARWLREQINQSGLGLVPSLSTPRDIYQWIWFVSQMHREKPEHGKNLRALFAKELIGILNCGFMWIEPTTKEVVRLAPFTPSIEIKRLPEEAQFNLTIDAELGQINRARFISSNTSGVVSNQPKKILVVHCPLSLSTCLNLDNGSQAVNLKAHYVIPNDFNNIEYVVQTLRHEEVATIESNLGTPQVVNDAIVIMLTGFSGKIIDGQRSYVNPNWLHHHSLQSLSRVILDVCSMLSKKNDVDFNTCKTAGLSQGTSLQTHADFYRWGDVVDVAIPTLNFYLNNPNAVEDAITLSFDNTERELPAGPVNTHLRIPLRTRLISVSMFSKCRESHRFVWHGQIQRQTKALDQLDITQFIYDGGPNGTGEQFMLVQSYDNEGKLIAWTSQSFFVRDFDPNLKIIQPAECNH